MNILGIKVFKGQKEDIIHIMEALEKLLIIY